MNAAMRWAGVAGLGAGVMYLLDPDRGRRRRAMLRDKAASLVSESTWMAGKTWRDVSHRAEGVAARGRDLLYGHEGSVDEQTLEARVRSRLGRVCSHPHAITVNVSGRRVRLEGPVLDSEYHRVLTEVRHVRGVESVDDALERHKTAEGVPGLQGGAPRPGARSEFMQENWTPAARVASGAAGGALLYWAIRSRTGRSILGGVAGAALLGRAIANKDVKRVIGLGGGRRAVDVQKTIHIAAPVEEVYRFWSNHENFPKFMRHIKEVRELGGGRSRWVAAGPAGVAVSWNAEITERIPNRLIAWKSLPGSDIDAAGIIRFEETHDRGTRVTIRLSYNPPAGVLGHAVASLFRSDPKSEMDEDLIRMKSLIEEGKTSVHGRTVDAGDLDVERPF
jgi:uncharacterized membrane protein